MFESANLAELAKIAQSVVTPAVLAGSKGWALSEHQQHAVRVALFGHGRPDRGLTDASAEDQSDLLSAFTKHVAGPIIELLPPHVAAFAVLVLYEEFVKAVFIQPALQADVGNEG